MASYVPPGWQLIPRDKARRAINPQGEVVSRRAYLDAQARQSGFKSYREYSKQAKFIAPFRAKPEGRKLLQLGSPRLATFKQTILSPVGPNSTAPGSPLATLLEDLGLRPKGATYDVGDTP
jgi:hypothetical protein